MKLKDHENPVGVANTIDGLAYTFVLILLATIYVAIYYFVNFEVAVLVALAIITMQVAQP